MNNIINRIGEVRNNNQGEEMIIIEYNTCKDIKIKFNKTDEIFNTTYVNFKNGNIKSHFIPTVLGVGIVGMEETQDEKGENLESYICWTDMLRRCYSEKVKEKHKTYKDCTSCKEWIYYKNFKNFYNENYYSVNDEKMHLDKDILVKGNKIYSPDTCIFVPERVNTLFTKSNARRGKFPIGVTYHSPNNKYRAKCKDNNGNSKSLGLYFTPIEAFQSYKEYKEKIIKEVADEYKDKIPQKLYDAMYSWEVNIDD